MIFFLTRTKKFYLQRNFWKKETTNLEFCTQRRYFARKKVKQRHAQENKNLERTPHEQTSIQKVKGICSRFHLVQV